MSTVQRGETVGDTTPLSMAVIEAIAAADGVDPVELDTPLYDVVDLDALDALTAGGAEATSVEVSFTYDGYEVVVDEERDIKVTTVAE